MEERGLRSEEFSETIGVAGSAVRAWLRGEKLPNLKNAVLLADYIGCSLDYLVGRSEHYEEVLPRPLPPFYQRLRSIMKEQNVKRYALTCNTTVKDSRITNWAKGESPSLSSLCAIADYLHVSLDYLVGRTDY